MMVFRTLLMIPSAMAFLESLPFSHPSAGRSPASHRPSRRAYNRADASECCPANGRFGTSPLLRFLRLLHVPKHITLSMYRKGWQIMAHHVFFEVSAISRLFGHLLA